MKPTRAVMRYHGGKWRMADWLCSLFPPHFAYVEPFGGGAPSATWKRWPDQVPAYVNRLRDVAIENLPWQRIFDIYDAPTTLFYCDPPYLLSTRAWDHRAIYEHEMTDADHAELLARLQDVRGLVVLSGYASPMYDQALGHWTRLERRARAQGSLPRTEVVWLNPAAAALSRQRLLALGGA